MSRSGYSEDYEQWGLICWRGAVASSIRGKRGQDLLKELLAALDTLPEPRLIANEIEHDGEFCALGAVGQQRGLSMADLDPEDSEGVAAAFGIANALACEIVYMNDEDGMYDETPEQRFTRMRQWVVENLKTESQ